MSSYLVRPAVHSDVPALAVMVEAMDLDLEQSKANIAALLKDPYHGIFVAELDGRLVGNAAVQDRGPTIRARRRAARLHDLFVVEEQRRSGIGRALFERARVWAAERPDVYWMEWQASAAAVGFYARLGFTANEHNDTEAHPFYEVATVSVVESTRPTE